MNRRTSILFLTNSFPDFENSNRAIFIKKLAHLLSLDGCTISVVTPKIFKGSKYFENQNGVKVFRFPFFARDKLLIEYQRVPYGKMILYYLSGLLLTLYVIMKYRCSLVHVHWAIPTGLIAIFSRALLRKPFVVTVHGSDLRLAVGGSNFLKRLFIWVCEKASVITCVSRVQMGEIEGMGIEGGKIWAFPMGIDESFLSAGRFRQKKAEGEPHIVLSNRNLLSLYNVSLLIRAIPMVLQEEPKTQFLIAGDGPEREHLLREAASLNLGPQVQFIGRIPHEKMARLLGQADIFVSTSLHDGTSVSLLEALGSGAFPIVTDIPSNREWIQDGDNGFLVPTDDERVLAGRIVEAIRNEALVERAKERNVELVAKKALWPVIVEKTEGTYSKIFSREAEVA